MSIDITHPSYDEFTREWMLMRDTFKGERKIKEKATEYLPPTGGHQIDGMLPGQDGYSAYKAYLTRAVYHNYVADAVESYIGLMHYKPTIWKLPPKMEFLREKATINGENLDQLLRKIHLQQFVTGRVGLLVDIDSVTKLPYISLYEAEGIINWDEGANYSGLNTLNLVVLDESTFVREGLAWAEKKRYRLLSIGNFEDATLNEGVYHQTLYEIDDQGKEQTVLKPVTPMFMGRALQEIPFVFVNTKDISSEPDVSPLLGLANLSLAIYRAEADYRHTLYMQGQDTLVVSGSSNAGNEDEHTRVGAGVAIHVDLGGDAKFIGVSSSGLSEMRQALQNDKEAAISKAGQLMNNSSKQESGDALKIRMAAKTANLNQVSITAAYAMEEILKKIARWMGEDDSLVEVTPNLQFSDKDMKGQDFAQLVAAINTWRLPLCDKSVHRILKEQGYTKLSYEEERNLIETDKTTIFKELWSQVELAATDNVENEMADNVSNPSAQVTLLQEPING